MNITGQNIDEWVERFMNGETTNEEEQALYRFFRSGRVPARLRGLVPMFAWYEAGMPGSAEEFRAEYERRTSRLQAGRLRVIRLRMAAAACVLLLLGAGLYIGLSHRMEGTATDCYEGSYVLIGGKRITDMETLRPYIRQALDEAERTERLMEELEEYPLVCNDIERILLERAPDEATRQAIEEALE